MPKGLRVRVSPSAPSEKKMEVAMNKKIFNKYFKRLMLYGLTKSLFLSLIVGFCGLLISSLIF